MLRRSLLAAAVVCFVPAVAAAQNITAHEITAPAALVGGELATFRMIVEAAPSTPSFTGDLVFVTGGRQSTAILLSGFGALTIPIGGLHAVMVTVRVPAAIDGAYQVGVVLDAAGSINETNEFDNFAATTDYVRVRAPAPDGVAVDVSAATAEVLAGDTVEVTGTVENVGELAGTFDVSVHLGRHGIVSSSDLEVGRVTAALAAGASRTVNITASIPAPLAARGYTLGLVVDPDAAVVEGTESNNTIAAAAPLVVYWDTLSLDTPSVPAATLTLAYDLRFQSSGGDGTYRYAVSSGALPDGLTLQPTGRIDGVPARTGSFDFDVTVTSRGLNDTKPYMIAVAATNAPVRIAVREARPGFKDLQYEQILVAGGGEGPYTWTIASGTLPDGLDLTTAGVISGIPRVIGMSTFEVSVEDFRGDRDTVEFTIQVAFASQVLILGRAITPITLGEPTEIELTAVGGRPPYEWTALTRAPPGITLTEDGKLSGTPTEVGAFKMRVRVRDSKSVPASDSTLVTVSVQEADDFTIVTQSLPDAIIRARFEVAVEATGGTPPLTWRIAPGTSLAEGFFAVDGDGTIAPNGSFRIYGIGFREVVQPFIVRVEDAAGRRREVALVLNVTRGDSGASGDGGCVCVDTSVPPVHATWLLLGLVVLVLRRRR